VPVSLGVLLDISDSMIGQPIVDARRALDRFMSVLLEPEDEAFVTTFNHGVEVVAPWTQPPSSLRGRLDAVRATGSTAIYDALAAAAPLIAARRNRRAALILISDGADTASDLTLIKVRNILQRSDPFVYAISIDSSKYPRASSPASPQALREITRRSGGYTEVVRSSADLGPATERIAYEPNPQNPLAYTSSHSPDASWRGFRVRMGDPDHFARARRGYVSVPPKSDRK
jgi:VWFA-related protein